MSNDFTMKEMLIETNNSIAKLSDDIRNNFKEVDSRIDNLEQHKASITSNFKFASWMFGALLGIGGLLIAILL